MFEFTPLLLRGRSYLNCNFDVKYWNPYLIGYGPLQINRELNEIIKLGSNQHWNCRLQKLSTKHYNILIPLHPHAYNLSYWCQKNKYTYLIPFPGFFVPFHDTEIKHPQSKRKAPPKNGGKFILY